MTACDCCNCRADNGLLCCGFCTGEACGVHGDDPCDCDSAERHARLPDGRETK